MMQYDPNTDTGRFRDLYNGWTPHASLPLSSQALSTVKEAEGMSLGLLVSSGTT